ncbi:hypothetical protein M085_4953, partial [Bacteroides fragilis str. 3986 N(B)19]
TPCRATGYTTYRANGVPMTMYFTEWHWHSIEIQRNKNF